MNTLEQTIQIVQIWYETKSPAVIRHRFNTLQGYKSMSDCVALTNLKMRSKYAAFSKEENLHQSTRKEAVGNRPTKSESKSVSQKSRAR